MSTRQHDPLSSAPALLSPEKRDFCKSLVRPKQMKQPKIAVFHMAMISTSRPTAPDESIAFGYMNLNKFHDREPEAIVKALESVDSRFFDDFPRRAGTAADLDFKKTVVGELAKHFYRYGLSAYGKPGLRSDKDEPELSL